METWGRSICFHEVCERVCPLTVVGEEITVDDVDQAVQLLFNQAAQRNLQDELGEQLAVGGGEERSN